MNFSILASVGAINAVIGLTPFIDSWCAVGGLICGMLSGAAIILANKHVLATVFCNLVVHCSWDMISGLAISHSTFLLIDVQY